MNQKNLLIYKASAGSGKTHLLTSTYLKLAFQTPDSFKSILAVTFTNKASEEMKARILAALEEIETMGKASSYYEEIAKAYPLYSEIKISELAGQILVNILHNYSQFAVSTIDSFVQRTIRSFAFETGLKGGYRIELDQRKAVDDLIQMLYSSLPENKDLLKFLVRYSEDLIDEGKNWNPQDQLTALSAEIFKEEFQQYTDFFDANGTYKPKMDAYYKQLLAIRNTFTKQIKEFAAKAKQVFQKNGITEAPAGNRALSGLYSYLCSKIVYAAKYDDFQPNKTVAEMLNNPDAWTKKNPPVELRILANNLYAELNPLLNELQEFLLLDLPKFITAKQILANFHSFGILGDIAHLMPQYRDENNLLLISDSTKILTEIISNNDTHYIYERIGEKYKHILIDEFQDTSGFQWINFKPLIANNIAGGTQNLIVGDIKQSIYRWRGGNWRLLLSKAAADIGKQHVSENQLDTNYRSRKNIIEFNNAIFTGAAKVLQQEFNAELAESAGIHASIAEQEIPLSEVLVKAYADTIQKPTGKDGGMVKIDLIDTSVLEDKEELAEIIAELLPQRIETLLQYKQPKDIAVLVRKNKEAKAVVKMLSDYKMLNPDSPKYDIISGDALVLKHSSAIKLILAALKYLQNSGNKYNLNLLSLEYNFYLSEQKTDLNEILLENTSETTLKDFLPKAFTTSIEAINKLPLFEKIEQIIDAFELNKKAEHIPYIAAFQDFILQYSQNHATGIDTFFEHWNSLSTDVTVPVSEKQNAVTIITVHKSKGLAFDTVIVPFCDWELETPAMLSNIMWIEPNTEPFDALPIVPVKYASELKHSELAWAYFDEKMYQYMDAINAMYVAFTRARTDLHIFAPYKIRKTSTEIKTVGELLQRITSGEALVQYNLAALEPEIDTEANTLTFCQNHAYSEKRQPTITDDQFNLSAYPVFDWRKRLTINPKSSEFYIESIQSVYDKVNFGTLMHRLFSKIENPAEIEYLIHEMVFAGLISEDEMPEIHSKVAEVMKNPVVASWFSTEYEAITETGLLTKTGATRIPDRIIIKGNMATVIDFKFGKPEPEHTCQVQEYMKLTQELGYENVCGLLYYAETDTIVEVFD